MKIKMMMTLVLLVSSMSTFATEMASYRFAERTLNNFDYRVYETSLSESGELTVNYKEYESSSPGPFRNGTEVANVSFTKQLNKLTISLLLQKVNRLAKAKIEVNLSPIVCAMMPGPTASNNHLKVISLIGGPLELVMGPQGCWVGKKVAPAHAYDLRIANKLKSVLKVLAIAE